MKSIGRELTEKGLKEVEEMDSNGDGKLEEGEVNLGEDSEGNDYSVNIKQCITCFMVNCVNSYSCAAPGAAGKINFKHHVL